MGLRSGHHVSGWLQQARKLPVVTKNNKELATMWLGRPGVKRARLLLLGIETAAATATTT
jgi:hypothetical protein